MPVPLSVLDLSPIPAGGDAPTALRSTVDLAQHAERWGYHRYWLAEHHFAALASSAPAVLIGAVAAGTDTIRVGSGAVQLGHSSAASVVEAFGTLESLYPGRIDLGIGRSRTSRPHLYPHRGESGPVPSGRRQVDGATTPPDGAAEPEDVSPEFDLQVDEILALLANTYVLDGVGLRVVPGSCSALRPWVFGSTRGRSAHVAAARGLPFVASYHITPATAIDAVIQYRNDFRPSRGLCEPYVVVSADVVVAGDTDTAKHLASSYGHWVHSIRTGGAVPYPDPDTVAPLTDEQAALVADRTATQFVGDPDEVAHQLDALQRATEADELVVTSVTHRHEDRLRSHELLAKHWGI